MEVIKRGDKCNIKYVLPIHDCFGTHPNDLEQMYEIIKLEFINLYSKKNFLEKFHIHIKQIIRLNNYSIKKTNNIHYIYKEGIVKPLGILPIPPSEGNLDLDLIRLSKYMFN